jgi:pseudaminic acid cytidylyltransferase
MSNLAIIPARGGSKRIPGKNMKLFRGVPIIHYVVDTVMGSGLFDEIMVSTDDEEIVSCVRKKPVSVPFMRSKKNSDDFATLSDVVAEVLESYNSLGKHFVNVCIILPTAVLIKKEKLIQGLEQLKNGGYSSVVPVVRYSSPIQRALTMGDSGILKMLHPENKLVRTQDLSPAFYDSGQFYWVHTDNFLKERGIFMNNSGAIELSEMEVQDIDYAEDWELAELKYQFLYGKAHG